MFFMVVERFHNGDPRPVGERFQRHGRLLPAGVAYQTSWVDAAGGRCFQIMEAASMDLLHAWTRHWDDLVDFEIVPVQTSAEFWAGLAHH